MRKFRVQIINNQVSFKKEDILHITKVLRKKEKDTIECLDNNGNFLTIEILNVKPFKTKILNTIKNNIIKPINVIAYIGVIKKHNFEWMIEKLNEINIKEITPVIFERTQRNNRLDYSRLQRIVDESCKQCNRVEPIKVNQEINFNELINKIKDSDLNILCYEKQSCNDEEDVFEKISSNININFIIGSEGGFSSKEIEELSKYTKKVFLTETILRTETAAIYMASILSERLKNEKQ